MADVPMDEGDWPVYGFDEDAADGTPAGADADGFYHADADADSTTSSQRRQRGARGRGRAPFDGKGGRGKGFGKETSLRGGAPPKAPAFDAEVDKDPKAWNVWLRKVDIWKRTSKPYLTPSEQGLRLLEALTGRAEKKTKHMEIEEFDHPAGVDRLVEKLRPFCESILTYKKHDKVIEYEVFARGTGEAYADANRPLRVADRRAPRTRHQG
jgi:hypothetical protein